MKKSIYFFMITVFIIFPLLLLGEGTSNTNLSEKDIVKEFIVDDFQKGINYDAWWFGSGVYAKVNIKPVNYIENNIVCEIDYAFRTINDDRIWISMNRMLSINDIRDYDVLHLRVISGGYGGQFSVLLVDANNNQWAYVNNDILCHKQDIELNIPLRRIFCKLDLANVSSLGINISYAGNLYEIPFSGKCWVDDIKFIKYKK